MVKKGITKTAIAFCIGLLVAVEFFALFLMYKSSNNKSTQLSSVNLAEKTNDNMFAVLLEQSDGTYTESDAFPTSGYTYNSTKSGCIDVNGERLEGVLSFSGSTATVDTAKTSYCYLYFDIK